MKSDHEELKNALRAKRASMSENHGTRLHRAISWLKCASEQADNPDLQFISLWVSFNACYSSDNDGASELSQREEFMQFVRRLARHDAKKSIYECLWEKYSGPVRLLIDNYYVYAPFWSFQQRQMHATGELDATEWRNGFEHTVRTALACLGDADVPGLLSIVLSRLYVLRNQLMHGGATYKSKINRRQVRDGANLLTALMPVIIRIMLAAPEEEWGVISWPVTKS